MTSRTRSRSPSRANAAALIRGDPIDPAPADPEPKVKRGSRKSASGNTSHVSHDVSEAREALEQGRNYLLWTIFSISFLLSCLFWLGVFDKIQISTVTLPSCTMVMLPFNGSVSNLHKASIETSSKIAHYADDLLFPSNVLVAVHFDLVDFFYDFKVPEQEHRWMVGYVVDDKIAHKLKQKYPAFQLIHWHATTKMIGATLPQRLLSRMGNSHRVSSYFAKSDHLKSRLKASRYFMEVFNVTSGTDMFLTQSEGNPAFY